MKRVRHAYIVVKQRKNIVCGARAGYIATGAEVTCLKCLKLVGNNASISKGERSS